MDDTRANVARSRPAAGRIVDWYLDEIAGRAKH